MDEEAVEHSAMITVVFEAVDEALIFKGLFCVRSPDDSLVQISDAKLVILCVVGEKMLVQYLGHVIDRPWVRRVEDGLINMASLGEVDLNFKVPFGDLHASGAITINTHGAQVRNMDILAGFHNCCQKIVRGIDIRS